jgi:hypothetical protein
MAKIVGSESYGPKGPGRGRATQSRPATGDMVGQSFVADRAVRSLLVVVSTPSLAFSSRIIEAHEPMRVQTLRSEFAVEETQ